MRIFKRGAPQVSLVCESCKKVTTQTFVAKSGTPWIPEYYYRCECGTLNKSKTLAPSEPETMYRRLKEFFSPYASRKTQKSS